MRSAPSRSRAARSSDRVQVGAVDGELRVGVAGGAAERLAVHELAEAVEEARLVREHGDAGQLAFQAEAGQLRGGVRQDVDADAERAEFRRRFQHQAGNAVAVQAERQGEPPDAAADDQHIPHARFSFGPRQARHDG